MLCNPCERVSKQPRRINDRDSLEVGGLTNEWKEELSIRGRDRLSRVYVLGVCKVSNSILAARVAEKVNTEEVLRPNSKGRAWVNAINDLSLARRTD